MDRVNVGGSQSGQQSNYISRGGNTGNNKWSLDGVDITDMSATGASPIYYDFDMMQEMQVTTGGADASQQTGGVGINFVTRSGTDRFKGSGRALQHQRALRGGQRHRRDQAPQGGGSGNADPEHQRLRLRGRRSDHAATSSGTGAATASRTSTSASSASTSRRRTCRPAGVPVGQIANVLGSTEAIRDCLATDLTTLNNYN